MNEWKKHDAKAGRWFDGEILSVRPFQLKVAPLTDWSIEESKKRAKRYPNPLYESRAAYTHQLGLYFEDVLITLERFQADDMNDAKAKAITRFSRYLRDIASQFEAETSIAISS